MVLQDPCLLNADTVGSEVHLQQRRIEQGSDMVEEPFLIYQQDSKHT